MKTAKLFYLTVRAIDGFRRRPWLHFFSILTLTAAFLSFTATLTAAVNLDNLLVSWMGSAELTAYLEDGVDEEELVHLSKAIEDIAGVQRAEPITPARAQERFAAEMGSFSNSIKALPAAAFPASVEIHLSGDIFHSMDARRALAKRLEQVGVIKEVELYEDWFDRLAAFAAVGRIASWGLGLLALVVAVLVVAAVVRTGVVTRRREIQVLGLVGATDRYVRVPFLLEGAIEATLAMITAVLALHFLTESARETLGEIMPLIGAPTLIRLGPTAVLMLIAGSALAGLVGSRISLRGLTRV